MSKQHYLSVSHKQTKRIAIFFSVALLFFTFLGQITHEVHANNTNLASISDGNWYGDGTYKQCPTDNIYYDTTTTHNGSPTWRVEPDTSNWQNNPGHAPNSGPDEWSSHPVNPGDHVIMSCWIKTSGATPINGVGARMGFDVGDNNYRIVGVQSQIDASTGIGDYHDPNYNVNAEHANFVSWGHDWTYVVWNFTVPSAYESDGATHNAQWNYCGYPEGTWHTPTHISPWCQVLSPNYPTDTYTAWFSDFQLYINPSSSPQAESIPTLSTSNVTVTNMTLQQSFVESGFPLPINLTLQNMSNSADTLLVQLIATSRLNISTFMQTEIATVDSGKSITLNCTIANVTLPVGNYTITANALLLSDLSRTNSLSKTIGITYVGDLNGDFKVDSNDLFSFANDYVIYGNTGKVNPLADFNHNGKVNFDDLVTFAVVYNDYWTQK